MKFNLLFHKISSYTYIVHLIVMGYLTKTFLPLLNIKIKIPHKLKQFLINKLINYNYSSRLILSTLNYFLICSNTIVL